MRFYTSQLTKTISKNHLIRSCIAVGTKSGFKIFSTDPFQLFYESSKILNKIRMWANIDCRDAIHNKSNSFGRFG